MANKKVKAVGLGPDRDDDFGVYLAQLHGHADEKGRPIHQAAQKTDGAANPYRDQSKRLIDAERKKKAAKKP